jgi:hypothetical protein
MAERLWALSEMAAAEVPAANCVANGGHGAAADGDKGRHGTDVWATTA